MEYDAKIPPNIDNEKMNFRVKFSELSDFQKKDSWLNFGESFEAIVKALGIE